MTAHQRRSAQRGSGGSSDMHAAQAALCSSMQAALCSAKALAEITPRRLYTSRFVATQICKSVFSTVYSVCRPRPRAEPGAPTLVTSQGRVAAGLPSIEDFRMEVRCKMPGSPGGQTNCTARCGLRACWTPAMADLYELPAPVPNALQAPAPGRSVDTAAAEGGAAGGGAGGSGTSERARFDEGATGAVPQQVADAMVGGLKGWTGG